MRRVAARRVRVVLGAALMAAAVSTASSPASAVPGPGDLTVTAVDANAGYFETGGSCPAKTSLINYFWTGAPNGTGNGQVSLRAFPFPVRLRMLAATPGGTIKVTVKCVSATGKTLAQWGPNPVTSGNAMLDVPPDSGSGRRIVYSVSAQQLWAIEANEQVARTNLVSGRRVTIQQNRSQIGVFQVEIKRRTWCHGGICRNFVGFHKATSGYIGFHQIPIGKKGPYQSEAELSQPRSGGCVRQSAESASWLYDWAQIGDAVHVVP